MNLVINNLLLFITIFPVFGWSYYIDSSSTLPSIMPIQPFKIANNYSDLNFNTSLRLTDSKRRKSLKKRHVAEISGGSIFDTARRGGLICSLCVVVDEQFVRAYQLEHASAVIRQIRGLVDRISWIFRNIDWDNDGIPDNIGFEVTSLVQGWNPYPSERATEYDKPKPTMELLAEFARLDFRSCCLGVGFTNRPFEKNQVGVSFIASNNLLGGICDFRIPTPPVNSANVALISAKGLKGTQMSIKDVGSVLLHEFGHAFGVHKHDADIVRLPECSGFDVDGLLPTDYRSEKVDPPQGRYIMWGQEIQGIKSVKANNINFSPCSRAAVTEILRQPGRAGCLSQSESSFFCGNGIVEYPEECDCGNEVSCAKDACCGARDSSAPCQLFKGIQQDKCILLMKNSKKSKEKEKKKGNSVSVFSYSIYLQLLVFLLHLV